MLIIEREKIFSSVIEQSFAFLYVLKIILCYMYFDNDLIMALKCMDFLLLVFLTYYNHLQCIITDGVTQVIFEKCNLFLNKE